MADEPAAATVPAQRGSRRGRLVRTFAKLKDALRRRTSKAPESSTAAAPRTTADASTEQPLVAPTEPHPRTVNDSAAAAAAATTTTTTTTTTAPTDSPSPNSLIAVDSRDDDDNDNDDRQAATDNDEPLLPMLSNRSGLAEDRARALFEKYGLRYQPPTAPADAAPPPSKVRRVERPVRLRIHWQCHDCQTSFGMDRTCANCGHRRCELCIRSPAKRVKQLIDTTKQTLQEEQTTTSDPSAAVIPLEPETAGQSNVAAAPVESLAQQKDAATAPIAVDESLDILEYEYVIQSRPNAAMQLVLRPTVRRKGRRVNEKPPEAPTMMASVQRVYRKPRQRVRWMCDRCQTMFTADRDNCRNCGHERCANCTRTPPKKVPVTHDPQVVQAVADKLARFHQQRLAVPGGNASIA